MGAVKTAGKLTVATEEAFSGSNTETTGRLILSYLPAINWKGYVIRIQACDQRKDEKVQALPFAGGLAVAEDTQETCTNEPAHATGARVVAQNRRKTEGNPKDLDKCVTYFYTDTQTVQIS